MSTPKHTWHAMEEVKLLTNVMKNTQTAYSEYSVYDGGALPLASKIRCKEHAVLMAAAPEMLALLNRVETHLASGFGNSQEYNSESNRLLDCILILRERIEGKE